MDNEPSLPHSSTTLVLRRKNRSDANDIQSTIARLETLVNLQDVPPSDEYQNLSTLGVAYMDRYMSQQDSQDILRAIDCWERANRMSSIQQESTKILLELSDAYLIAYHAGVGGAEALEHSIHYSTLRLERRPREKRGPTHCKIGHNYADLHAQTQRDTDLDAAINHLTTALEGRLNRAERQGALMELTRILLIKFSKTKDTAHLDAAIYWLKINIQNEQHQFWTLCNLADLLHLWYREMKEPKVLDEAIETYQRAWQLYRDQEESNLSMFCYNFGTALIRRYNFMERRGVGSLQDIERAIELLQQAGSGASPQALDEYQRIIDAAMVRLNRARQMTALQASGLELSEEDMISPEELRRTLDKGKLSILLLDIRHRGEFEQERIDHDSMVWLEPNHLNETRIKTSRIERALTSATEQGLFRNRAKFDQVVIYDQNSTTLGTLNSPLSTFFRCISSDTSLKRSPRLLIGGFAAWKREEDGTPNQLENDPSGKDVGILSNVRPAELNEECIVCIDEPEFFPLHPPTATCSHKSQICLPCLQHTIREAVRGGITFGRDDGHIMCPNSGCDQWMKYADIKNWAEPDVFEEYDRALLRHELVNDPHYVRCLNTKCNGSQLHEGAEDNPIVKCISCGAKQCFRHQAAWHEGYTCEQWDEELDTKKKRSKEDKKSKDLIDKTTKVCPGPGCGRRIEKTAGCDHFTCKRPGGCGFQFCWECLAPWAPILAHDNSRHYPHCKYYTPESTRRGRSFSRSRSPMPLVLPTYSPIRRRSRSPRSYTYPNISPSPSPTRGRIRPRFRSRSPSPQIIQSRSPVRRRRWSRSPSVIITSRSRSPPRVIVTPRSRTPPAITARSPRIVTGIMRGRSPPQSPRAGQRVAFHDRVERIPSSPYSPRELPLDDRPRPRAVLVSNRGRTRAIRGRSDDTAALGLTLNTNVQIPDVVPASSLRRPALRPRANTTTTTTTLDNVQSPTRRLFSRFLNTISPGSPRTGS